MLSTQPMLYSLDEMIAHAREHASFYRSLYSALPERPTLAALPIIEQVKYWDSHATDRMSVLTAPLSNGMVLNSGGTTGAPKYSYVDDQDWNSIVALSARTYEAAGLQDGDRVANLFGSGNLYASFLFATESLRRARPKVLQLPLAYSPNILPAVNIIREFKANVLAGVPSHFLRIIEQLEQEEATEVRIDRIIYGGELCTKEQQAYLENRFPGIQVRSAGYASVDAGLIGYADAECAPGEHRVFDEAMILEVIDEDTGEAIEAAGQPGRLVFTSLLRRLMPMLRYPTGDRGEWAEAPGSPDRKFRLLGRSEESARLAYRTVDFAEVSTLLAPWWETLEIRELQIRLDREDRLDRLTFCMVANANPGKLEAATSQILEAFATKRSEIHEMTQKGIVHPTRVEWINRSDLAVNPRTGKQLRIVDWRNK